MKSLSLKALIIFNLIVTPLILEATAKQRKCSREQIGMGAIATIFTLTTITILSSTEPLMAVENLTGNAQLVGGNNFLKSFKNRIAKKEQLKQKNKKNKISHKDACALSSLLERRYQDTYRKNPADFYRWHDLGFKSCTLMHPPSLGNASSAQKRAYKKGLKECEKNASNNPKQQKNKR